jgi:hypothetical protein
MLLFMTHTVYIDASFDGCDACRDDFPCPDCLQSILEKISDDLGGIRLFEINNRMVSVIVDPEFIPDSATVLTGKSMTNDELVGYLPADEAPEDDR